MSDVVLPCATCGAETSAALAGEIAYVEPPAGPTRWLCPACSARLPVALDYITESRGGGDPHDEYTERLESALMAPWFELLMERCAQAQWHADGWIGGTGFAVDDFELGQGLRIIRAPVPPMTVGQLDDAADAMRRSINEPPLLPGDVR